MTAGDVAIVALSAVIDRRYSRAINTRRTHLQLHPIKTPRNAIMATAARADKRKQLNSRMHRF